MQTFFPNCKEDKSKALNVHACGPFLAANTVKISFGGRGILESDVRLFEAAVWDSFK